MDDSPTPGKSQGGTRTNAQRILRWLASTKLTLTLIVVTASVLAIAVVLEWAKGREYAQWYVYKSPWFVCLLGLLALSTLLATLARFPWRRGQRGFLLAHAGLLVLLAGAFLTFASGIEGQLIVDEGQSSNSLLLTGYSQLTTVWNRKENPLPTAFVFESGPTDWPEGQTLPLRALGGVQLEVLKFYRHARTDETWVEDPSAAGNPAVELALAGAKGMPAVQQWFVANPLVDEVYLGAVRLSFQRASAASMLEDFNNPPNTNGVVDGILSIHHDGQLQRIPVRENVGKKVAVGKSGLRVEITSYLPDARPDATDRFKTASQEPNNPLIELSVHLPDKDQPLRQIAFAKHPLLNLDAIHDRTAPIKFWYHHPAVILEAGAQFLQMPDGKLFYRVIADGKVRSHGEVKQGSQIDMAGKTHLSILKYLPHASKKINFVPARASDKDSIALESAVLVKVQAGGKSSDVWLKRLDPQYGFQQIVTPEGTLGIAFGYERLPLDFSVKLDRLQRDLNPATNGKASFASEVRVINEDRSVGSPVEIAASRPLVHSDFTFCQSGHYELPSGKQASILAVTCDPGRSLKHLGSLMIGLGLVGMFYRRASSAAAPRQGS